MGFISDTDALKFGKQYLSDEEYAKFPERMMRMRHFDNCLATNTPSHLCRDADPAKNLEWCRLGLRIETLGFEYLLEELLSRMPPELLSDTA